MVSNDEMIIEALVFRQLRPFPNQAKRITKSHSPRLLTKTVKSCVKTTEERNMHSEDSKDILV